MSGKLNFGSVEIPLSEGAEWTKKYRDSKEVTGEGKITGYLIPLDALKLVLDQDIDAVRAYKGINNAGEETLIFVGTKLDPETGIYRDVFRSGANETAKTTAGGAVVYDTSRPVPPFGDPASPLE
ncbi:hypothetical protein [Flavobacterium pectinovorum]|uniref:hypothetical protein n=1 Tax=Flavobacterium pectinovorum TaxID=29533 RepID=UPI001FACBC5D|nr:hypothetical protein [Flavobacterium pectinovorum]MCI9846971.1 hypothetical protein [Flavobacterium pectinovorum]